MPQPLLSTRRRRDAQPPARSGVCITRMLPRDWYERVGAMARGCGGTAFHAILAALCVYFTRTERRHELVVGLPVFNRGTTALKVSGQPSHIDRPDCDA